jgi:lysophospholipid acyltransferase (LPLAT)-like uncharacterized protein
MSNAEKPANPLRFSALRQPLDWMLFAVSRLASQLIVGAFLFFDSSVDVRVYGLEKFREVKQRGQNVLLVLWHGQGLMPITLFRQERLCLYASHARDPKYSWILKLFRLWTLNFIAKLGYSVLDASQFKSESRGVMQFVDILRSGAGSVIAADGPAGPIYKAKPGPGYLAKKTQVVLIPLGAAISRGVQLDQWDRFEIPFPFSQCVIVVGDPIEVDAKADDAALEAVRLALEAEMIRCMNQARTCLGLPVESGTGVTTQQVQGECAE